MNKTSRPPHLAVSIMRGGTFIADAIFITLVASLAGYIGWHFADKPNWAAFMMVGGAIAALWALWAFLLFGIISYFWGAAAFWRTLHPLNIALAMLFGASYAVFVHKKFPQALAAFTFGIAVFMVCRRYLPQKPRTWLLLCLAMLVMRYAVSWRYASIMAATAAAFIGGAAWINFRANYADNINSENTNADNINSNNTNLDNKDSDNTNLDNTTEHAVDNIIDNTNNTNIAHAENLSSTNAHLNNNTDNNQNGETR